MSYFSSNLPTDPVLLEVEFHPCELSVSPLWVAYLVMDCGMQNVPLTQLFFFCRDCVW